MTIKNVLMSVVLVCISAPASAQQHGDCDRGNGRQHGGQMREAEQGQRGRGQMNMSRSRHLFVRDRGIGESYRGVTSPLIVAEVDMGSAKTLYDNNCASCHGEKGLGDGAQGSTLDPAPTNIARFAKMPMARDDYLLWTLSEGGQPVTSAMPEFKTLLTRDEIWQVIAYLRQL